MLFFIIEIPVGIVVPPPIFHLYSFWLGHSRAYSFLLEGKLMTAPDAFNAGLVNEICTLGEVESRAIAKAEQYAAFNHTVWRTSKSNFRKQLIEQLNGNFSDDFEATLNHWWSDESRNQLQNMINGLKQKSGN